MSRTAQIVIIVVLAVVLVALCAVVAYLLLRSPAEPEPPRSPTFTPTVKAAEDDSWDRIKAAGKIVVGTSADYPPFEYFAGDSQIDGFDVALMDEIGRRLGVGVEYRNMAFDGLGSALQLGQIDAAIAAISVTPERQAAVDFSNVYFVGEDGILASEDSADTAINSLDELSSARIGVQRGSVHQDWVQSTLVDTGLLPADNLFVYLNAKDAVRDLRQQRLELVILDSHPAQVFAAEGGVKVVGQGLNQQLFAIALPKGAHSLKAEIDSALTELHNAGVVAELAKTYLNLDELLPTPLPEATSTPGPAPACFDGLALVEHLNHDDQNMAAPPEMQPGQAFTKGWRVQNTGTCTWDGDYRLVYAGGNRPAARMGGEPVPVEGQVAPGDTYDIDVELVAPLRPRIYQGFWQMNNGENQAFGDRLPVGIQVPAAPTPTPAPTQTPAPGISFTVDRTNIKAGECIVFSWKAENVKEVYFYTEGERWQDHGVAGEGRQQECPPVTTTYLLRVVKSDNSVQVRQIAIYVEPVADAPVINRFTVDPPNQIPLGSCVDIRWDVGGEVDMVTVTSNDIDLWEGAPIRGSLQDCPAGPATVAYGIETVGPGGTSRRQETINVIKAATPEPTAAPDLPLIRAFSVSPNQIPAGECIGISWRVGGGTSMVRISQNEAVVLESADLVGQQTDCLSTAGDYLYRLEAFNLGGNSVSDERIVSVTEGAPSNPLAGSSWEVTAYYDGNAGEMATVLGGTTLTAAFGPGGDLNGSGGCNTYSARYVVEGNALSISPPRSTSMTCEEPAGIMEQEAVFLVALQATASFSIEADQLYLSDASGQVVLEFVRRDR
jgi:ABC-type amino acid transport substrate-binding protein/heat shock protein HslJ